MKGKDKQQRPRNITRVGCCAKFVIARVARDNNTGCVSQIEYLGCVSSFLSLLYETQEVKDAACRPRMF